MIVCVEWRGSAVGHHAFDIFFVAFGQDGGLAEVAAAFGTLVGQEVRAICFAKLKFTTFGLFETLCSGFFCFQFWHVIQAPFAVHCFLAEPEAHDCKFDPVRYLVLIGSSTMLMFRPSSRVRLRSGTSDA